LPIIVSGLHAQPGFGAAAEPLPQALRQLRGYRGAAVEQARQGGAADAQRGRSLGDGHAQLRKNIVLQNLTQMDRIFYFHCLPPTDIIRQILRKLSGKDSGPIPRRLVTQARCPHTENQPYSQHALTRFSIFRTRDGFYQYGWQRTSDHGGIKHGF
jgi:hypothetical protein